MRNTNETKNTALRTRPALVTLSIIIVLLILTAVVLYPAAQDYYFAFRENQILNAEYTALLERNDKIQQQIDEMQTPQGIADKAREDLGWVLEGEEAVNITGLGAGESSTALPQSVDANAIVLPESWWTQTLDEFFDYKPANEQQFS